MKLMINVHHAIIILYDFEIYCIKIYKVVFYVQENSLQIKYSQYWCHHFDSRSRLDKNSEVESFYVEPGSSSVSIYTVNECRRVRSLVYH